jgi:DNA polymerase elongation subunit (family B)
MSFDLESLYPSIMRQYNISPDTILEERAPVFPNDVRLYSDSLKDGLSRAITLNATITANGTMYDKNKQGFIPFLVGQMFDLRKSAKREMLEWEKKGEAAKQELERRRASS